MFRKRGLSPVMATVLLVAIAVVIALIILLWARNFVGESIEKSYGGETQRIESFCGDVSFSGDVYLKDASGEPKKSSKLEVSIDNKGDVPLYGVQIKKKKTGSKINAGLAIPSYGIKSGETQIVNLNAGTEFENGDDVIIAPALLGEVGDYKKFYVCDDEYGIEEKVKTI